MRQSNWRRGAAAAGVLAVLVAACSKSDSGSPADPSASGTTITISAAGATPRTLVVQPGSQITFINNDSVPHDMFSDPHPEHTDCPEFDSVGHLVPGATRQTKNLTALGVCGFHDHINPGIQTLKGSIRVQKGVPYFLGARIASRRAGLVESRSSRG